MSNRISLTERGLAGQLCPMAAVRRRLFLFPGGALFLGPVRDNEAHRHHAIQFVVSPEPFELSVGTRRLRTRCALIAADVEHALDGDHALQNLILLDRESSEAEELSRRLLSNSDFQLVEDDRLAAVAFDIAGDPNEDDCPALRRHVFALLKQCFDLQVAPSKVTEMDGRIVEACRYINEQEDLRAPLEDVADHVGLSEGRFTHLFKEQMGIPLRRYILWLRLRRAIEAAAKLDSLTDAAHAAGFADQAHFTRTFRDMFGLKPGDSLSRARSGVEIRICSGYPHA